jgi:hypothetical protein
MKSCGSKSMKKKVIKHVEKDDKEFRGQIKDDKKLIKTLKKAK